jgi:membrane protease YdiL (CAAX protease family)
MQAVVRRPAVIVGSFIWAVAMVIMDVADPQVAAIALGTAVYAAALTATLWLIPARNAEPDRGVLRATRTRWFWLRLAIVAASTIIVFAFYIGFGAVAEGAYLPFIFRINRLFVYLYSAHHFEPFTAFNFVMLALVPGALLFALGAKPRELGLTRPVNRTYRAMAACLVLPAIFVIIAFVRGRLSLVGLLGLLVHNLFSNGFSEEFFARGMIFSYLRALTRTDWALLFQALIFALMHVGGTIREEHGSIPLIIANVIAENLPVAISLGIMALRSRSLVLPAVVHISLDTMKDLVMG